MTTGSALLTLEDAYDEATSGWPADAFDEILGSMDEWGADGADVDEHARARVEIASPSGLVARLQDATYGPSGSAGLAVTLDLLRAADRLASWAAAQWTRLVAQVHTFSDREHHTWLDGPRPSRSPRRSWRPQHC